MAAPSRPEAPIAPRRPPAADRWSKRVGAWLLLCFLAQIWPIATVANRIEPRVLGMPFFMAWYVGGVFAVFLGLVVLFVRGSAHSEPGEPVAPGDDADG